MKQNYSENLKHEEPFQYFVPKIKELHELELAVLIMNLPILFEKNFCMYLQVFSWE